MKSILIPIVLTVFCLGCSRSYPPAPSLTGPALFVTFTPIPTLTRVPTPAPTITPTAVPAPFVPFYVATWADNVLLRANPGYLFSVKMPLKKGTPLLLLGRSPGGEWLLVQTPDDHTGWVFAQLINIQGDMASVPFIQPADAQLVRGRVIDASGQPITGIQFAIVQGPGANSPRTDAMTDSNGNFYAFMPLSASGTWSVSYTAVACTSNTMDANCNCKDNICDRPYPDSVTITLPHDEGLLFVWR